MRRFTDALLPFLTGITIGVLATLGAFSGRLASLETITTAHGEALKDIRVDIRALSAKLDHCLTRCQ